MTAGGQPSLLPLPCPAAVSIGIDVLVPRQSSLQVVVGSGGSQIQAISTAAQRELEEMWGQRVHLSLRAKVEK